MNKGDTMKRKSKHLVWAGILPASLILLAGCGGAAGDGGDQAATAGFDFGAPQDEVDAVLADLEPVTLTFQPYSGSNAETMSLAEKAFMDAVEERSNGQISFEVAWGQSIAGYSELDDALTDGRVDIAYTVPVYFPDEYPKLDAYNKLGIYTSNAPVTGEAALQAQMTEAGWNDPELLEEFSQKGLTPLNPLVASGNYWAACNAENTSLDDWEGNQVRIGGSVQTPIAESIGASPVSMEYGEAFEALQRRTVDCTFIQGLVAGSTGMLEAAPNVSLLTEERFTGAVTAAHVAGSSFEQLPLAYQQIIFDAAGVDWFHGQLNGMIASSADALEDARDAGGGVVELEPEVEDRIIATQRQIIDDLVEDGLIESDLPDRLTESGERWTGVVEELGYSDDGETSDLHEWYDPEATDFRPLAEEVMKESALEHRPSK